MKCEICGKEIEKSYYSNAVLCSSECHTKHFWIGYVARKDEKNIVRHKGVHYVIGNEKSTSCFRGFDGARFTIYFKDGRTVQTSNLWYQGTIPQGFRNILKDNADRIENGWKVQ